MSGLTSISTRLRQAILLSDYSLVERLLKHNIQYLHNPDYANKSNTSLHLAAQHGLFDIAKLLISLGHDRTEEVTDYIYSNAGNNQGISVNTDGQCALHLAAANGHKSVIRLLCEEFPQTVNRLDQEGRTPLLLAAGTRTDAPAGSISKKNPILSIEDIESIEILLDHGADVCAQDVHGNTCLHNACAFGNLKAVRALIQAGADPLCSNYAGWTPDAYSLTVQADVYYRNLVAEYEKRRAEDIMRSYEQRAKGGGGAVRLVTEDDEEDGSVGTADESGRSRADSSKSEGASSLDSGFRINAGRTDSWR